MTIQKFEFGNDTIYMENGQIHNDGEPAWIHSNGTVEYYTRGKLNRADGPARTHANGEKEFWFDGIYQGKEVDGVFYPWKKK